MPCFQGFPFQAFFNFSTSWVAVYSQTPQVEDSLPLILPESRWAQISSSVHSSNNFFQLTHFSLCKWEDWAPISWDWCWNLGPFFSKNHRATALPFRFCSELHVLSAASCPGSSKRFGAGSKPLSAPALSPSCPKLQQHFLDLPLGLPSQPSPARSCPQALQGFFWSGPWLPFLQRVFSGQFCFPFFPKVFCFPSAFCYFPLQLYPFKAFFQSLPVGFCFSTLYRHFKSGNFFSKFGSWFLFFRFVSAL